MMFRIYGIEQPMTATRRVVGQIQLLAKLFPASFVRKTKYKSKSLHVQSRLLTNVCAATTAPESETEGVKRDKIRRAVLWHAKKTKMLETLEEAFPASLKMGDLLR